MANGVDLVGIVNVTEDSFSDGGRFLEPGRAIAQAEALVRAGAAVVELGPASSHPDSIPVPATTQIERLKPVVDALAGRGLRISIDATDSEVLRWALEQGVDWLNDVRGFGDRTLDQALAASRASLVVVHSLGRGERARREDATPRRVLESIDRFFDERLATLVRAGIGEERLIVDPGMGFFLGSDPRASLAVLQRLPSLRTRFGRPILVSVSRKSFLRTIAGSPLESIGPATLAAELFAVASGADYVRTHDVGALRDALAIQTALARDALD